MSPVFEGHKNKDGRDKCRKGHEMPFHHLWRPVVVMLFRGMEAGCSHEPAGGRGLKVRKK